MGPTPILEMARAYGLHPRLWLLILHFSCFSAVFRVFLGVVLVFLGCSGFSWGCSWFSWGVSGFLGAFRVFLGVFLVFLECSGFSWGVPGFLGSVPGFLGVFRFFGCSGMFRDVPVFRCSVFRCSWKYYMPKIAGFFASLPFVTYRCNKILKPSTHCMQL